MPLMEQGQVDIAVGYLAIVQPVRTRGGDVALAKPAEGWSVVLNVAHIVDNSPNAGLAAAYINAMMESCYSSKIVRTSRFSVSDQCQGAISRRNPELRPRA